MRMLQCTQLAELEVLAVQVGAAREEEMMALDMGGKEESEKEVRAVLQLEWQAKAEARVVARRIPVGMRDQDPASPMQNSSSVLPGVLLSDLPQASGTQTRPSPQTTQQRSVTRPLVTLVPT